MTANYFRALAALCRTASRDSLDLFAKEEFRQPATEFNAKAGTNSTLSSKHPGRVGANPSNRSPSKMILGSHVRAPNNERF